MATKSINAILNLKDNMSKNVKKVSTSTKDLKKQTKLAEKQIKSFGYSAKKSYNQATASVKKLALAGIGFVSAYAGLSFLKETTEYAKGQVLAETKLAAILKNVKGVTSEHVEGLKKHASALQNVGVIGDEVTLSGMAQLGTFQLQASSIETLSEGMLDLLANQKGLNATQEDAQQMGNLLGKVMNGQVGALSRVGISFTKAQEKVLKYGTEQEKASTLAEVLKQNVGGVNKALAQTDDGQIQQASNSWGDFKEVVGFQVTKALGMFAGWFNSKIPVIQTNVEMLISKFKEVYKVFKNDWVPAIKPVVTEVINVIVKAKDTAIIFVKAIKDNWGTIAPVLAIVLGGFLTYKTVTEILRLKELAYAGALVIKNGVMATGATTVNAMTIAQWALNTAMKANPIGIVIGVLTALIAVGVLVYKNWDTIKLKAFELWEGIKAAFAPVADFFNGMWEGIKGGFKAFINFFVDGINKVTSGLNAIKIDIPDWVPKVGGQKWGLSIPQIPRFAMGTPYFKGGLAQVNERGGEIVNLPNGSQVIPADKSEKIIKGKNGNITINFYGDVYGDEAYIDSIGNRMAKKIKLALANM